MWLNVRNSGFPIACFFSVFLMPMFLMAEGPDVEIITQVATGVGVDARQAEIEALRAAVQQAAGSIISADTLVKNDELIRDKVLIYSNGIVKKHELVGSPQKIDGGLVRVTVRAQVEKRELMKRLEAASIQIANVEAGRLVAKWEAELANAKDGAAILAEVLSDLPSKVIKAEVVGDPRRISSSQDVFKIGIKVRFSVDKQQYKTWRDAAEPILTKLATGVTELPWEPGERNGLQEIREIQKKSPQLQQFPVNQLALPTEERAGRFDEDFWGYVSMTAAEMEQSVGYPDRCIAGGIGWIPAKFLDVPAVIVLDRGPKGIARVYSLPRAVYAACNDARIEVPVVRLTLLDDTGKEIAAVQRACTFYGEKQQGGYSEEKAFAATPLWWTGLTNDGTQELTPLLDTKQIAAHGWGKCLQSKLFVAPFVARKGFGNLEYQAFLAGFEYEFRLELGKDELARVKRIEAKILVRSDPNK